MKNNYLIVSNDKVVIDSKISKILSESKIKDKEIIKFDMEETSIDSVIEELDTYNFLSSMKIVICYNCSFFETKDEKIYKILNNYLDNPSENYLIMTCLKIGTAKETIDITKKFEIIDQGISSEYLVKQNLDDYKMENKIVKYFVELCMSNNEKIINELDKIKLYKLNDKDKNITKEDIDKICVREYDDDVFDLVNAIASKNKEKAFELYERLSTKVKDATLIVASVSSNIRNLYSVKVMKEDKVSLQEMANILGVKSFAVTKALENSENYSKKKLLALLDELSEIDYKSKSGEGNANLMLELLLLNL